MAVRSLLSPVPVSERVTAQALQSFFRGGSWQALAREIALTSTRSAGVDYSCLGWLTPLVEERFLVGIDGLEFVVDGASASARGEYLGRWPADAFGADVVAARAGYVRGSEFLERLYAELLVWAGEVLAERVGQPRSRFGQLIRLGAVRERTSGS